MAHSDQEAIPDWVKEQFKPDPKLDPKVQIADLRRQLAAKDEQIATLREDKTRLMLDNASWESTCDRVTAERDGVISLARDAMAENANLKAVVEKLRGLLQRIETRSDLGTKDPSRGDALWEEVAREAAAQEQPQ